MGSSLRAQTYCWDTAACCSGGGWISHSWGTVASFLAKSTCGWEGLLPGHGTAECAASHQRGVSPFPAPHASVPPLLSACTRLHGAVLTLAGAQHLSQAE